MAPPIGCSANGVWHGRHAKPNGVWHGSLSGKCRCGLGEFVYLAYDGGHYFGPRDKEY